MKNHNIEETENNISISVELNKRTFIKDPVETVNIDVINQLLRTAGHSTDNVKLVSGPRQLTNYVPKGNEPSLSASWVFEKKNIKKTKINEIKVESNTSNEKTTTKSKRNRRTKKLS